MNHKVCNLCGKKLDFWDIQERNTIEKTIGYGSKYDGARLSLRLCCKCMDDLIDRCEASPVELFF